MMPSEPTVFGAVLQDRLLGVLDRTTKHLDSRLRDLGRDLKASINEALGEAYAEGVRDGFLQGVARETELQLAQRCSSTGCPLPRRHEGNCVIDGQDRLA